MIPIRDNIPARTVPFVNYLIIALCSAVFIVQWVGALNGHDPLVEQFGMIPARVLNPGQKIVLTEQVPGRTIFGRRVMVERPRTIQPAAVPAILTLLTCIFLHGGWLHFLGNMWFLAIFGDNVEDRLGHFRYLLFYLLCGVLASIAHLVTNLSGLGSVIPTVGASGAIAGVMGAYLLLYPRAQVLTLMPFFILFYFIVLPAPVYLGIWFLIQFLQGYLAIGAVEAGGVAWWAHIGGFVAGAIIVQWLRQRGWLRPAADRRRTYRNHRWGRGAYTYR